MKSYTMHEIVLYFIIPNLNLLQTGYTFVLQDLTPPIVWKEISDHKQLGAIFGDIIKNYSLPVKPISKSGTTKYQKF